MSRIQILKRQIEGRHVNTDDLMWNTLTFLHQDLFQHTGWTPPQNISEARKVVYNIPKYASPYVVKCKVQLASWLKRYRFQHDLLSDQELQSVTDEKFLEHQHRIGVFKPVKYRTSLVLREARVLLKSMLGDFKEEELLPYCRFSRNSTVGFRGQRVYLSDKIYPGSNVTGTKAEIEWFNNYLRSDPLLSDSLKSQDGRFNFQEIVSLKQVNVPKSAKIMRPVRPNSLIGSFRSYGIGELVRHKLKTNCKIDLNRLQDKHQRWAMKSSRKMHLVTADLSSASDNFTSWLLNMLLPRSWFRALSLGRTRYVTLGNSDVVLNSPSFMAMGVGYTFTVMTACFFAILKAVMKLSGKKGVVSVFGDDLIYPISIHHFVVGIFDDLNFPINHDKTFSDLPFRESCGGDYYDQIDVRPASPKGVQSVLKGNAIAAYVYKLFNTLIRRWEAVELPNTFNYLRSFLSNLGLTEYSVPSHFPDESGFKDGNWRKFCKAEVISSNRRQPFYGRLLIPCLVIHSQVKPAGYQGIYYWERLQKGFKDQIASDLLPERRYLKEETPNLYGASSDVLIWRKKPNKEFVKSREGVRYRKLVAYVSQRRSFYDTPSTTLL